VNYILKGNQIELNILSLKQKTAYISIPLCAY